MFYVYQYIDPRTMLPFYIGKGKGDRIFKHLKEDKHNTENKKKYAVIKHLQNMGLEPIIEKVAGNLTEDAAYTLEEQLIKKYGRRDIDEGGILTNICASNRPPVTSHMKGKKHKPESIERMKKTKAYKKGKTYEEIYGLERAREIKTKCAQPGESNGFYGKKHKPETLAIMQEKAKSRPPRKGHKLNQAQKVNIRMKNKFRKPIHTPFGKFVSVGEFVETYKNITAAGLHKVLQESDKPIHLRRASRSSLFTEEDIGKTPRDLGWYYED